jgi:homoserine dehydrogenase
MTDHTRRVFLGSAAAAAGVNALAATTSSRIIGPNDRINVGIIGVGGMGFSHVRLLKQHADTTKSIQLVGVSDIYTKRKHRAKDFIGLEDKQIHHDYHELLARPEVDGVFIATPDHWHFRMAMDALDAGKDVYLQKPNLDAEFGYQLMTAIGLGVKAYRESAQMNFMPTKRESYEGDGKNVDETQAA